jgi:DNA-binding PadR family transcriptional regulator
MSTDLLTPTSRLVLGLLAHEGPSTPYDLKRHVAASLGQFWPFPHALLYAEPPRLVSLGLATEHREQYGRRRRIFTITPAGREAVRAWLGHPSRDATEIRDGGLLQLFFSDQGAADARGAIAREQLDIHRAKLVGYEADDRRASAADDPRPGHRTADHWRSRTMRMGLLYEQAAVGFWEGISADVAADDAAISRDRAAGLGSTVA